MRLRLILAVAALAAFPIACKHKEEVAVPKEDIPREIAIEKLRTTLPSCQELVSTAPSKETLRQADIREWLVRNDGFEVRPVKTKTKPIVLNYADIVETRMEKSGGRFYVKLYTTVQKDPNKEQFTFLWSSEDNARTVDQSFEALRKK
jgi:hypothetical protein